MLNLRGSIGRFRGGGLLFVLRLPGSVKGVNGPCDDDERRLPPLLLAPSVTGDVNGVWGGIRWGPPNPPGWREADDALP